MAASGGSPKILAMLCAWHPLTAADNAGMDGCAYGTSTTIVPVDCAGVVSAAAILKAFSSRADGVLVATCGRGDCHYVNGNESCEKVVDEARELMRLAGIAPARLRFDLSSDVDGARFAALIEEFSAEVSGLNGRGTRAGKPVRKKVAKKKPAKKAKAKPKKKAAKKKPAKKAKAKPKKKAAKKKPAKKAPARKAPAKKAAKKKPAKKAPAKKAPPKKAARTKPAKTRKAPTRRKR